MAVHDKIFRSWGLRESSGSTGCGIYWRDEPLPPGPSQWLPYGLGRSYGDSCLLDKGCHIESSGMDHLISFEPVSGVLRCEAGCSIARLLEFALPRGWFIPVTPGTKFVTVGGCLANDVHGKNHHSAGTFGCFVNCFGLRRSDGSVVECSASNNADLFRATIGGLGLTGLVLWVELRLKRVTSPYIRQTVRTLNGVGDFFESARQLDSRFEYSVAWLDASHAGNPRGLFIAGDHMEGSREMPLYVSKPKLSMPVTLPDFVLGPWSIDLLNRTYYTVNAVSAGEKRVFFDPFFYPLDAVSDWNRAYGKKGLVQYQFVVPMGLGPEALAESLGKVQASGQTSFLTVVKLFGPVASPGLLSFPRPGVTVCFDFPHLGSRTLKLLEDLDRTVFGCQGALYPAKDFRMSRESFERSFPAYGEFRKHADPAFASNFSKRTGLTP